MSVNVIAGTAALRLTDRRRLIGALNGLGAPDAADRAEAARRVSQIVQRRRVTWTELLLPAACDKAAISVEVGKWPSPALALLERPDLTEQDRAALRRVAAWKSPGTRGLEIFREVAERIKVAQA